MKDLIDKFTDWMNYIILISTLVVYFLFQSLRFDKGMLELITDYKNLISTLFVVVIQVITAGLGRDKGIENSLIDEGFIKADKINNEIIADINDNFENTLDYIDYRNDLEVKMVRQDYIRSLEKRTFDDLTKREVKKYNKLKPKRWTSKGISLPLYYEHTNGKVYSFDTSFDANANKIRGMIKKALTGLLFAFMTFEVVFVWKNAGQAMSSTIILAGGMAITYILNYLNPFNKLTKRLPKQVENKKNFHNDMKVWRSKQKPVINNNEDTY